MSHNIRSRMDGGSLVNGSLVALEAGNQEQLKSSHIKVDDRFFSIDPNLDFDASTIEVQDRYYPADNGVTDPTQPISYTIQPQFNVFRSLSESRFIFRLKVTLSGNVQPYIGTLKAFFSSLLVNNITLNINNVNCADQHSRTAQYAHFVKLILTESNLAPVSVNAACTLVAFGSVQNCANNLRGISAPDHRTYTEGMIDVDSFAGIDSWTAIHYLAMLGQPGYGNALAAAGSVVAGQTLYSALNTTPSILSGIVPLLNTNIAFEVVYRPQDGIFRQPKFLPPGVQINWILNLQTTQDFCNGQYCYLVPATQKDYILIQNNAAMGYPNPATQFPTFVVQSALYVERQYTITQTGLKAFQSLIMRQPLYYSCLTSNTLLFPVAAAQASIQLTNLFAGRLPNIIVIGLLSQQQNIYSGNSNQLLTYSPTPGFSEEVTACISSCILTVNGRRYPLLWSSNMAAGSNNDVAQWYEQYKQCCIIKSLNGRNDGATNTNLNMDYKADTPLLSFGAFKSCFTYLCFNIRRNGTIMDDSGDKEVGSIDALISINGTVAASTTQLMLCGLNTDSLLTVTDGGSSTSFVY